MTIWCNGCRTQVVMRDGEWRCVCGLLWPTK